MIGGRGLLRGELQLRPHNLAGEVPCDAALRDGHHYICERIGHQEIALARGIVEPPGAPKNFERNRFESNYATRLKRSVGLYFGL